MKKGDRIAKTKKLGVGDTLMLNFESQGKAEEALRRVGDYYDLPQGAELRVDRDPLNPGRYAIAVASEIELTIEAQVNWRVGDEIGIVVLATGDVRIVDLEKEPDWKVVHSAPQTYQSSVEHMSDEALRESIENLRHNRIYQPKPTRKRATPMAKATPQEKKLQTALASMSPEKRLELQRKLGLID